VVLHTDAVHSGIEIHRLEHDDACLPLPGVDHARVVYVHAHAVVRDGVEVIGAGIQGAPCGPADGKAVGTQIGERCTGTPVKVDGHVFA